MYSWGVMGVGIGSGIGKYLFSFFVKLSYRKGITGVLLSYVHWSLLYAM